MTWKKSSYSGNGGCLEVDHQLDGSVLIRNSNRPDEWIQDTKRAWDAFVAGVNDGEFGDEPCEKDMVIRELRRKNLAQGQHMANLEYLLMQAQARINQLEEIR